MKFSDLAWKTTDGLDICARLWEPDTPPKAIVCLVHGHGEHSGRYEHVAEALAHAGYAMLALDQRGHGRSGGPRGHTPSYEALMQDIGLLLEQARARFPRLPCFLYGHSMGGNEVINFALRRKPDLAGVIASGPWLRLAFTPPAWKVTLGRLLNNIHPRFTQRTGLEVAAISRDPRVVQAYIHDPLVHDRISSRLYFDTVDAGDWALAHAADFPLPLLLMHGGADRLSDPQASREFARRGGSHITFHLWEEDFHEVHNELDQKEVLDLVTIWMDARLPS